MSVQSNVNRAEDSISVEPAKPAKPAKPAESVEPTYKTDIGLRMIYINYIRRQFAIELADRLELTWVPAPLFVTRESGLNDDLNGSTSKLSFVKRNKEFEIVQSLAKWKRLALKRFNLSGLYTDMNAIRMEETEDETHSMHVDQWDWEKVIDNSCYTGRPLPAMDIKEYLAYNNSEILLKQTVSKIFKSIRTIDRYLSEIIPNRRPLLSNVHNIYFTTSEELLKRYPTLSPIGRERAIAKEKSVVFVSQIGKRLSDNTVHGERAKDYDNWEFNGDIIVWNPCTHDILELSSMGIRVDSDSLRYQYECSTNASTNAPSIPDTPYHRMILNDNLPKTIGGGIGQSRLYMYLLQLPHIDMVHPMLTIYDQRKD